MSRRRLGLYIGRREATLLGVDDVPGPVWALSLPISSGQPFSEVLPRLFEQCPQDWRTTPVYAAISPAYLACSEISELTPNHEKSLEALTPTLAESLAAGESAEELYADAIVIQRTRETLFTAVSAISRANLDQLRECVMSSLPQVQLMLVTPASRTHSLCMTLSDGVVVWLSGTAREVCLILKEQGQVVRWRMLPQDDFSTEGLHELYAQAQAFAGQSNVSIEVFSDEKTIPLFGGKMALARYAPAVAVTQMDPERDLNLLRGDKQVQSGFFERFKWPAIATSVAATLVLTASGFLFNTWEGQNQEQLKGLESAEAALHKRCFPTQPYKSGMTVSKIKKQVDERSKLAAAAKSPSALAFWTELAQFQPDPDRTGFTLEGLQLGPEGGRISGRVPASSGDPLGGASLIEQSLNRSSALTARGEFENQGQDVLVRLLLDYHPQGSAEVSNGK